MPGEQTAPAGVLGNQGNTTTLRMGRKKSKKYRAFVGKRARNQMIEDSNRTGERYSPSSEGYGRVG